MDEECLWMLALKAGEAGAFEKILDRWQKPMLNFFHRFLGSAEAAEDASQRLFLQLYRSAAAYEPRAKFSTYLYRMAKNLAINLSRRDAVLRFLSLDDLVADSGSLQARSEEPDAAAERCQREEAVRRALLSLPARQRMAVVLSYFEELDDAETAERLDCSLGAVQSLLFRAREALSKNLSRHLLLFLLVFSCLARAGGLAAAGESSLGWGRKVEAALLLLPSAQSIHTPEWLKTIESRPALRVTLALSGKEMSALGLSRAPLFELRDKGQIEPALRLAGDPPLPLIYDMDLAKMFFPAGLRSPEGRIAWPEDAFGAIVKGRKEFQSFWNTLPRGFVPGGGSLSLAVAEFLKKQQFLWSAASFPESEWRSGEFLTLGEGMPGTLFIYNVSGLSKGWHRLGLSENAALPEVAERQTGRTGSAAPETLALAVRQTLEAVESGAEAGGDPCILVFDEARSRHSLGDFLSEFAAQCAQRRGIKLVTLSEIAEKSPPSGGEPSLQLWPYSWPWLAGAGEPHGPGLAAWVGDAKKNLAWQILAGARRALDDYKDSGQASLEKLDRAMGRFLDLESGEFFEWLGEAGSADPALLEKQREKAAAFKAGILALYQSLGAPAPESVRNVSLLGERPEAPAFREKPLIPTVALAVSTPPAGEAGEGESGKKFVQWSEGLVSWEYAGEHAAGPAFRSFRVESSTAPGESDAILFRISLDREVREPLAIEVYVDVNHRSGAGSQAFLAGRAQRLKSEDGWEFALSLSWNDTGGWRGLLYSSNQSQPIASLAVGSSSGTALAVRVPKRLIGERPMRWGYLGCIYKEGAGDPVDFLGEAEAAAAQPPALFSMIRLGGR